MKTSFNRREFLKIIGAGGGLAVTGCTQDLPEKLIPYVIQPDEVIPGISTWYAGTCGECSAGCGLMARTREGRVVKLEGLPGHPINKGGLCARGQASLQGLYDPDRVREAVIRPKENRLKSRLYNANRFVGVKWAEAIEEVAQTIKSLPQTRQAVILCPPQNGTQKKLLSQLQTISSNIWIAEIDLLGRGCAEVAAQEVFGVPVRIKPDLSQADVIISIGANFLETWDSPVEYSRSWASNRRPPGGSRSSNGPKFGRLSYFVQVEPRLSLTGANADRWIRNKAEGEYYLLLALLKELMTARSRVPLSNDLMSTLAQVDQADCLTKAGVSVEELRRITRALVRARNPVVLVGGAAVGGKRAKETQRLGYLLNYCLGSINSSFHVYSGESNWQTPEHHSRRYSEVQSLSAAISGGKIGVVICLGMNPLYSFPTSTKFEQNLSKVDLLVSISSNFDETATRADLVLGMNHPLESWWDSEPVPGLYNISQPVMQPLYQTQSSGDILLALARGLGGSNAIEPAIASYLDYLKVAWKQRTGEQSFEERWPNYVQKGWDVGSFDEHKRVTLTPQEHVGIELTQTAQESQGLKSLIPSSSSENEGKITLLAFSTVLGGDGSQANKPWLQEVPDPLTTVIWGSWVEMHPSLAASLGYKEGDVVRVRTAHGAIDVPILVSKLIDPSTIAVPIGQGHRRLGRYAAGVGVNVFSVLDADTIGGTLVLTTPVLEIEKVALKEELIRTQMGFEQGKRELIAVHSLSEIQAQEGKDPHLSPHEPSEGHSNSHEVTQLYHQMEHPLYRWGMTIDLALCTGCSACVVACYAENNIAIVGKELAAQGREMSWLRIDRYLDGPEEAPVKGFLPMMCQQCNNAPCEPVCPVYATYHSEQGLNTMVYNRCVGTRYCSNNCPYKVRRFNWFRYAWPEPLTWQLNPDVTVREVGVMEKCTFCVQRIREATVKAKDRGRKVLDGEVVPACASSCPTEAITFGNLLDSSSKVNYRGQSERRYQVLDKHVNTQPAITYLEKVRNDSERMV